jgi:8-oxo-dGTP diphosphatase
MGEYRATRDWPYHISCGGAVYRQEGDRVLYALLFRKPRRGVSYETWHLPKGTLHREETLEACALREIREESGLDIEIEDYLGSLHGSWMDHARGRFVDKTTHYFLCRHLGASAAPMDNEHDRLDWCTADEAVRKLGLVPKREAEIIRRAETLLSMRGSVT